MSVEMNIGSAEYSKKVLIFGASGRVGLGLVKALLGHNINVCVVDFVNETLLKQILSRIIIDTRLSCEKIEGIVNVYGDVDALNQAQVVEILQREQPDIVVNYAIPLTWDAAKQLPNYNRISRAGLGAFAPAQVLIPKIIAQALTISGIDAKYIVGNLPDISVPIIYGLSTQQPLQLPISGAGNVGLIESAIKHYIAVERQIDIDDLQIFLVAHHIHWVAPREPGYQNDAPFLLKVLYQGNDITDTLGDERTLMNQAITNGYESGAGFSSTTALLAAKLVLAILDDKSGRTHVLHVPAPNGLPGGYPVNIANGIININLPIEWQLSKVVELMKQGHQKDGIVQIAEDGSIHLDPQSVMILKQEIGIDLPEIINSDNLEWVAKEQIKAVQQVIKNVVGVR